MHLNPDHIDQAYDNGSRLFSFHLIQQQTNSTFPFVEAFEGVHDSSKKT